MLSTSTKDGPSTRLQRRPKSRLISPIQGRLSFVNIDGHPSDAQGESTLDIQMAAGLAPAASVVVYQTDGNADGDTWVQVNDELQRIIDTNVCTPNAGSVVSISLGIDEGSITSGNVRALDKSLQQLTLLENMTVFVASGDCGAFATRPMETSR